MKKILLICSLILLNSNAHAMHRKDLRQLTVNTSENPQTLYVLQAPLETAQCCSDHVNNSVWDSISFLGTLGGTTLTIIGAIYEAKNSLTGAPGVVVPALLGGSLYWATYIPSTGKRMVKSIKDLCMQCKSQENPEENV